MCMPSRYLPLSGPARRTRGCRASAAAGGRSTWRSRAGGRRRRRRAGRRSRSTPARRGRCRPTAGAEPCTATVGALRGGWRTTPCSCSAIDMSRLLCRGSGSMPMTVAPGAWFNQGMRSTGRNGDGPHTGPEPRPGAAPTSVLGRAAAVVGAFDERHPGARHRPSCSRRHRARRSRRCTASWPSSLGLRRAGPGRGRAATGSGCGSSSSASCVPSHRTLSDAALPLMEDLREATHQRIHLAVLDGIDVVYVEILGGGRPRRSPRGPVDGCPAHATGVGKAMLAYSPAAVGPGADRGRTAAAHPADHHHLGRPDPRAARDPHARAPRTTARRSHLGLSCVAAPVFGSNRQGRARRCRAPDATVRRRPGAARRGGTHRRVHPEPAAARVRARSAGAQRLMSGERTPPTALSPSLKKSSRWMSRGKSRLAIIVFRAASTIGGGPQR